MTEMILNFDPLKVNPAKSSPYCTKLKSKGVFKTFLGPEPWRQAVFVLVLLHSIYLLIGSVIRLFRVMGWTDIFSSVQADLRIKKILYR